MKRSFSIRTYLGLSYVFLLVLTLGALAAIWSYNEYDVIAREMESVMIERVSLLSNILGHEFSEHGEVVVESEEIPIVQQAAYLYAVYFDPSGDMHELAKGAISPRQAEIFQSMYASGTGYGGSVARLLADEASVYAAAPVLDPEGNRIGTVCLLMPLGELASYILRLRWLLLGAIVGVGFLGFAISIMLTNILSRQFSQAQSLAATVSDGGFHLRIPEKGPSELQDLSRYLNQMAEKLQNQAAQRQQILANVAHELARPLGGLQVAIESLRKGAIQDPELADDLLVNMGQTIHRLEDRIDDITLAARVSRTLVLNPEPLAVEPFLRGVATRFWSLADMRGIKIEVHVEPGLPMVYADEKRLNQIVGNLVDNAIKFTPHGQFIRLSAASRADGKIALQVLDSGTGITPDESVYLFEPFYQGDVGRRIKQGMGLGLSIARQLARAMDGDLVLENHPNGGAAALLTLPAAGA